jgi:hypothetical protein
MASTAPILINLTLTQRDYVKIFCTSSHKSIKKYGRRSHKFIEFSIKVRLALSRISRNALLFDAILVQNWSTEFHENRKKGLVSDTE